MRVGVIGGSGFIGSHIVDKLIEKGHDVTVFDIMKPQRPDVNHIVIDIIDISKTTIALAGGYDVIYMLAAMADVNDVFNNPIEATEINIMGVANVLEAARRNHIKRVIFSSTIWVYEMAGVENVSEDTYFSPVNVKHVYTASKLAAEMYLFAFQKLYGINFTILRYGIPYGPRARGGTVAAIFVKKAFSKEPLTINGDGLQYRNFIYVEDLAEGNVAALNEIAINKIYNIEGLRPISVKEVADTVKKIIGGDVKIVYTPARPGDFSGKIVSRERAKQELGWEPKIDFEEGLKRYIKWYKELNKITER